jgi:competence protein ComEA
VEYRDQHGSFKSADDLTQVKGIGEATVEKNRSRITL